jgi:hypothetical protein
LVAGVPDQSIRLSTGTPFTPLSPAVRNHRIAVRLPSESLSALRRIPHVVLAEEFVEWRSRTKGKVSEASPVKR